MTNPNIRFGLQIPLFTFPDVAPGDLFERVSDIAVTAEDSGFDSVFVMDHFYQLPGLGRPEENMFEAYTLLSALAACTHTVRLGCMVGGMTYRNPAFLAKTVTCLDVISKGRAIWGIGAGWFEQEHQDYNFEFGSFTDRFEKLEEGLQIAKSMFVNDTTTFEGKWFKVTNAFNVPKPVQAGGPPILIGGSGEKKTLRMVAQYGDACNVFGDATHVRHLMGVLDEHCAPGPQPCRHLPHSPGHAHRRSHHGGGAGQVERPARRGNDRPVARRHAGSREGHVPRRRRRRGGRQGAGTARRRPRRHRRQHARRVRPGSRRAGRQRALHRLRLIGNQG